MSNKRGSNNLAFNDLLFNVLIGFVLLFVIAFLLINPITKKSDIPTKAEFIIVLEWDDERYDDVDIWVQRDNTIPVGFSQKDNSPLHLDRDDLGNINDRYTIDGQEKIIKLNREVVTIRGLVPGDYFLAVHLYSKRGNLDGPVKYKVTVIKVNPFAEVLQAKGELNKIREIHRLPAFTVNGEGNVENVFRHSRDVVPTAGRSGI